MHIWKFILKRHKILPIIYPNKTKMPGKKDVSGIFIKCCTLYQLYTSYLGIIFGATVYSLPTESV